MRDTSSLSTAATTDNKKKSSELLHDEPALEQQRQQHVKTVGDLPLEGAVTRYGAAGMAMVFSLTFLAIGMVLPRRYLGSSVSAAQSHLSRADL